MRGVIMLLPFFQSSVLGLGALLCWSLLGLRQSRCKAKRKGDFKRDNANSSLSFIFPSFSSSSFLSSLPFLIPPIFCNKPGMFT